MRTIYVAWLTVVALENSLSAGNAFWQTVGVGRR